MAECPGVYRLSEMRDGAMARVRVPGGEVSSAQLRCVADLARSRGNGLIDITNRANLQIRGLGHSDGPVMAAALREVALLCADPDADRLRNITASPLAGLDPSELIDVRPHVAAIDALLQGSGDRCGLSVKFAFVLDGGGQGSLGRVGHDLGFFARALDGAPVFEISLAGQSLGLGLQPDDLEQFVKWALRWVRDHGASRVRDILAVQPLNDALAELNAGTDISLLDLANETTLPGPDLAIGHFSHGWTFGVPLSRLTADQAAGLAEMASRGRGVIRLTPFQSVVLPGVKQGEAEPAVRLRLEISEPTVRIVACAGASGCVRTSADTKADGLRLRTAFNRLPLDEGERTRTIHLSGCERGCAMPGESDILALAQPQSANYALHAGSRPSIADQRPPSKTHITPSDLPGAIRAMID